MKRGTKRMVLMLIGVGILFGGIFGFKAFVNAKIGEFFDNMPQPVATVTATEAREIEWRDRLETVGSFSAVQGTLLTTEVGGIVRNISFESGTAVDAGDELMVLDAESDHARLRSLEAAERLSRVELERAKRLVAQRNLPEAELSRRQSEADQAAAAVAEQRARIRQKTLRAPFAGELGIRKVSVGQFIGAGDPVVSLQTRDPIHVDFSLSERFAPRLAEGQEVRIVVGDEGLEVQGRVHAIAPSMSESTRTFAVQAVVPNPEGRLRPGMFGRVTLETGEPRSIVVVPLSAVQFSPYGNAVFVIEQGEGEDADDTLRVRQRFVQTGARRGEVVEIVDGLAAGDRVVSSGLLKLRNGAPVAISDDPDVQPGESLDPHPDNA